MKFDDRIILRAPSNLIKAIDVAADKHLMKASEYIRRSILEKLARDRVLVLKEKDDEPCPRR